MEAAREAARRGSARARQGTRLIPRQLERQTPKSCAPSEPSPRNTTGHDGIYRRLLIEDDESEHVGVAE